MYSESFNGLRCPERPLEVHAVLKHVGAVETELRRPLALLLLRFVVRVVVLLLLGLLLSTILRPLELLHAVLEPHILPAITVVGFDGKTRFVALPGPDPPYAGSTEPFDGSERSH
jgi:hypothetical protein